MGVTLSHTNYAPLSLVSTVLGFISFTFTLATLLKVFWSNVGTFNAAPHEVPDFLSGLKQGLLGERRHLRRVRRRLKSLKRDRSHGGRSGGEDREGGEYYSGEDRRGGNGNMGHGRGGGGGGHVRRKSGGSREEERPGHHERHHHHHHKGQGRRDMYFERDIQSLESSAEEEGLKTMRSVLKNLIKKFRALEQPFLRAEYKDLDSAHWSASPYANEKPKNMPQYSAAFNQHDDDDESPAARYLHATNQLGQEYKSCGIPERWLWVKRKAAFIELNEILSRVEVRRTAHEVGEVLSMVVHIGRDLEGLRSALDGVEGRLNRVVGVRRID